MVIKDTIWYAPAAEPRGLHIYLPDNYDSTDERYPVTYFWDGHNLFSIPTPLSASPGDFASSLTAGTRT